VLAGILLPHAVCTLFVAARTWSRLVLLRKWFLDDTLMVAAWVFSTAVCVVYSVAAETPNIRQAVVLSSTASGDDAAADWDRDGEAVQPYMLRTYLGLIFYQLCLCAAKLSILAFYLRMFHPRPLLRRLAWATVIFVILYGVPLLFMSVFQCHPAAGQFFGRPMTCFDFTPLLITSASLHTATDAWLIIMVVPCVSRLDLPPRQKIALAVVLSLSIFVIAASLTRLQLSLHANYRPSGAGVQVANTLGFFVMTILECDIALICASAPTLRPLLARMAPALLGLGEPVLRRWPSRRRMHNHHRGPLPAGAADNDRDDNHSMNLTSVVSYHGYPWTEPSTPLTRSKARSRTGSRAGSLANMSMPMPPVPAAPVMAHRTPTTLSLRSFMSGIRPRSRGVTMDGGEDRKVLLRDDDDDDDKTATRDSTVGFEGYYDQYLGYGEEKKSRSRPSSKRAGFCFKPRNSSQESFVLGINDPASPTRLSPISGHSDTTLTRQPTQESQSHVDAEVSTEKDDGLYIRDNTRKGGVDEKATQGSTGS